MTNPCRASAVVVVEIGLTSDGDQSREDRAGDERLLEQQQESARKVDCRSADSTPQKGRSRYHTSLAWDGQNSAAPWHQVPHHVCTVPLPFPAYTSNARGIAAAAHPAPNRHQPNKATRAWGARPPMQGHLALPAALPPLLPAASGPSMTARPGKKTQKRSSSGNANGGHSSMAPATMSGAAAAVQVGGSSSSDDASTARAPCAFFLKHGTCAFGDRCKFDHPAGQAPPMLLNTLGLPVRPGEPDCSYYCKTWKCSFGQLCKYNHPDPNLPWGMPHPPAAMGSLGPEPRAHTPVLQARGRSASIPAPTAAAGAPYVGVAPGPLFMMP